MTMHIGMVTSATLPPEEGIGHYVWNLSRHLVAQGHRVDIITRGSWRGLTREDCSGVIVWRPPFVPLYPFHVHFHGLFVNRVVRALEDRVDIFHVHSALAPVLKTGCPVVVTVHTPMLANVRSFPVKDLLSFLVKLQLPVSVGLERATLGRAARVAAVSSTVRQELAAYGLKSDEVAVMGNGVDTDLFCPSDRPNSSSPYLLAVGRLGLRKGQEDLILAASDLLPVWPSLDLRIAGSGPFEGRLRRMIGKLGLEDHVKLLGHVGNREDLVRLYQGASVFVHPAHYEGLPTALLEAMACGRAVVATAVGGALDVLDDGVNGILVPPRDPRALATAILELLQNRAVAERLGSAARRTVQERFSWPIVASRYVQIYQQVVGDFAA